ncbi:hypothetical protein EYF80_002266 [Liparis tanakae]|uniref:Uncharacterized protein n=1 Tax=Liparis tanakae TaxID=230148 RepID=A0A4Z2JBF1_9TELE|nr:hypothetical protein EYF80_002266 [Liparis tanakae]
MEKESPPREAQQAAAEVSADADAYRGITKQRPGARLPPAHPVLPTVKGPADEHVYLSVLVGDHHAALLYAFPLKCCSGTNEEHYPDPPGQSSRRTHRSYRTHRNAAAEGQLLCVSSPRHIATCVPHFPVCLMCR